MKLFYKKKKSKNAEIAKVFKRPYGRKIIAGANELMVQLAVPDCDPIIYGCILEQSKKLRNKDPYNLKIIVHSHSTDNLRVVSARCPELTDKTFYIRGSLKDKDYKIFQLRYYDFKKRDEALEKLLDAIKKVNKGEEKDLPWMPEKKQLK